MKESKARYIVELDVKLELFQFHILEKRFEIARHISNACKQVLLDRVAHMRNDANFRFWIHQPNSKERSEKLKEIRESYDVSQNGAERIIKNMGKHFKQKKRKNKKQVQKVHLDSHVVQKIALQVWKSVSDYLFGKGKKVHFKKYGQFHSVEGKNNQSGLTYENSILYWNGLEMKVSIPVNDHYLQKALQAEICFCRLVRKTIRGQVKYYLQLVLKGIPPQKREPVVGKVGMDMGISTVAAVSEKEVMIEEFCDGLEMLEKEKKRILRKMDRSRRATNPGKYHPNGTIKQGNRTPWVRSRRYWKWLLKLKEINRKIAAVRKIMHNELANRILQLGNHILCEKMNYKGLQKGLFGKRIGYKAPSAFLATINQKLAYQGKSIQYVNTWMVKASQYCHVRQTFTKKKLSERFHLLPDGTKIQRDCYSAWLIQNVNETKDGIDSEKCSTHFESFLEHYKKTEDILRSSDKKLIASIGL